MVFWSTLRNKIKGAIQRREFEDLKNKVDNDVVFKRMTANTTISNTENTIFQGRIMNISSTGENANIELRTNGTGSIDCGNKKITSVANPTTSTDAANKAYIDTGLNNKANATDVYLKSQTYTRAEIDNKDSTINNRFSNYYTRSEADNKFAYLSTLDSRLNNYYTKSNLYTRSECDNRYLDKSSNYVTSTQSVTFTCRDVAVTGPITKYYMVLSSGSFNYTGQILNIYFSSDGTYWTPAKQTSTYVDIIGPNNVFSYNRTYNAQVTFVKSRTY